MASEEINHGTHSAYRIAKCRCGICKEFKREIDRKYREKNAEIIRANTLRSRIATALAEAQEAHNGLSDLELADAVIRELKLLDLVKKLEADWTFIPGPDYPAEGVADD